MVKKITKSPVKRVSFPFPKEIKTLFKYLKDLRIVGGAVRDFLVKKPIVDFDLACKYLPEQTTKILENNKIKTLPTGLKYGTITALINSKQFQITTLRQDKESFGRDCKVEFTDDFYEDAARRDFTINAMSIDQDGILYDYFDGQNDLKNQKVRFIGEASIRIKEDYLRILRFFRFSCSYAKTLDKSGLEAAIKYKNHLNDLSNERVREEVVKMLKCENRKNLFSILQIMFDKKILNLIFPKINQTRIRAVERLFLLEKKLKTKIEFKIFLAVLICDNNSKINLTNSEKKYLNLVTKPKFKPDFTISKKQITKLLLDFNAQELIDIHLIYVVLNKNFENLVDDFMCLVKIVRTVQIPDFPVNGNDLLELKINPKNIGKTLKIARDYWWQNDFKISKKEILSFIKEQNV